MEVNENNIANLFLEGLQFPTIWKYQLHILKYAKDDAVKTQVYTALKSYLVSIGNMSHLSFIERIHEGNQRIGLLYRNIDEEQDLEAKFLKREVDIYRLKEKEADFSVTASAQTRQLRFWNAIMSYKRDTRLRSSNSAADKYYEQRATLHMILGDLRKAYVLAKKAKHYELMIALSFLECDYRNIINLFEDVCMQIENTPITVITNFELFYLIGFSFLASWNFRKDDNELFEEFISYLEGDKYKILKNILLNFQKHQYKAVIEEFNSLSIMGYISMYIQPSFNSLKNQVNQNVVAHLLSSYVSMNVADIKEQTGLSAIELPDIICECIFNDKLCGRYDYVARKYVADPDEQEVEGQNILDNCDIIKSMVEVGVWKGEIYKKLQYYLKEKEKDA